jgi:hypothetical protein
MVGADMPSRPLIAAIVLFWLGTNGYLFYTEVLPRWRAGEPPPYTIDLTEEVGANRQSASTVNWNVLQKGSRIGQGFSQVGRRPDRTYELRTQFRFEKLKLLNLVDIRKIASTYHINEEGELLGLSAQAIIWQPNRKGQYPIEHKFDMDGTVADGQLVPRFFYNDAEVKFGAVKVPVSHRGNTLNPLHPVNRVQGLSEGRTWRVPLFDPLSADLGKSLAPEVRELLHAAEGMSIPVLEAIVTGETLAWDGADVPCFKIEYRKPGERELKAATWVRRRDGLVLQQFSSNDFMDLTLQRIPER